MVERVGVEWWSVGRGVERNGKRAKYARCGMHWVQVSGFKCITICNSQWRTKAAIFGHGYRCCRRVEMFPGCSYAYVVSISEYF